MIHLDLIDPRYPKIYVPQEFNNQEIDNVISSVVKDVDSGTKYGEATFFELKDRSTVGLAKPISPSGLSSLQD